MDFLSIRASVSMGPTFQKMRADLRACRSTMVRVGLDGGSSWASCDPLARGPDEHTVGHSRWESKG